jgi:cell division protein FtsQ
MMDEKTEHRLRVGRMRRTGVIFATVALIAGAVALYVSPVLRVQNVEIVGATTVDPSRIEQLAALAGDSMFRLDLASVQDRIAYLPMVKSVEISRGWPQTVRIQITERTPWGVWQVGSDSYVIDSDGVVLPDDKAPDNAPVIKDLGNPVRLIAGDHVDLDAVRLTQQLVEQLPNALQLSIAALEYNPANGLTVTTDAGYRVVVGDSQNMEYKLAVWQAIEGKLGRDEMAGHVLDLRFGDRPSFQ